MQAAHFTSSAIFWDDGGGACFPPPGRRDRHAWLAAWNLGSVGSRSLPGPALIWNATPAPGAGSGKSWMPWLRMHCEYAIPLNEVAEPATLGWLAPLHPAARMASPSKVAATAMPGIGGDRRGPALRATRPGWLDALVISLTPVRVAISHGGCTSGPLTCT